MTRVRIEIVHREASTLDIGDLSPLMVQKLLEVGDGSFGNTAWSPGDYKGNEWTVESISVEPLPLKKK